MGLSTALGVAGLSLSPAYLSFFISMCRLLVSHTLCIAVLAHV